MKKLLIAMTAAAVGTCAWAAGEQTLLKETFTGWNLSGNTWWSYSADAAEGELTLVTQTADNEETEVDETDVALSLNTGSKVLTGSFTSDDQPKAIGTDGLYFKSTVTFKDPSDTLPELKDSDKFALVVLDNVESIEEGYTADPATNLWVIAKYGESGQRAYQLDVEVDPTWLAAEHEIVVKAYENVMASGYTACAGFIVMVDETVCKVMQSCALEGNVINYAKSCAFDKWNDSLDANVTGNLGYLGYPLTAINPKYQKRYYDTSTDNNYSVLILSNVPGNGTLKSVDFQGQGVIDDVELTADGTGLDFGTDSLAIAVTADDGVTLKNCADGTLYYSGTSAEITFELYDGYKLKGVSTNAVEGVNGVYSLTIDPTQYPDGFKVEAFLPVVSVVVGEETLEFGSLSEAISKVAARAELTLTGNIALTEAITIAKDITINLNGKTLSAVLNGTSVKAMFTLNTGATLTIVDSGNGNGILEVTGSDRSIARTTIAAGLTIKNGTINAKVAADKVACTIEGGKFLKEANATIAPATGYAATDDGKGYWVVDVASTSDYPESDKFVGSDTALTDVQKKAVEATFEAIAGEAADADAAVTNYFTTVYGENAKVPVATITGAKNVGISVANNLPLMTSENAEFVAEAVAADDGNVAAFEFTLKDGNTADAETLLLSAQTAIQKLIKVCSDLKNNSWTAPTIGTDVDATVTDGKIKVQLKSGKANFMKIQATAE